jgi:hypothetical protein
VLQKLAHGACVAVYSLEKSSYVHRDIAARNLLLAGDMKVCLLFVCCFIYVVVLFYFFILVSFFRLNYLTSEWPNKCKEKNIRLIIREQKWRFL